LLKEWTISALLKLTACLEEGAAIGGTTNYVFMCTNKISKYQPILGRFPTYTMSTNIKQLKLRINLQENTFGRRFHAVTAGHGI
jgi:hypothetical protein